MDTLGGWEVYVSKGREAAMATRKTDVEAHDPKQNPILSFTIRWVLLFRQISIFLSLIPF